MTALTKIHPSEIDRAPLICDCCGRADVGKLTSNYWLRGDCICHDCFLWWFEGGLTNKTEIKAKVLAGEKA